MTPTDLFILALIPVLIAASALCSASETALFGLSYNDRLQLRRLRPRAAAAAEAMLASPRALLVGILISNMCVNALLFALGSVLLLHVENRALGIGINTASVIGLIVFGEVLPKMLAGAARVTFCRVLAPSVYRVYMLIAPVRRVVEVGLIGPLARLFRPEAGPARGAVAGAAGQLEVGDLERLLELGASQGAIDRDEQSVIAQVLEIGQRRVWDVMTPRTSIRWVDRAAAPERVIGAIRESGHRYLPVYARSPDHEIVGMLDARRYVAAWAAGGAPAVDPHVFPVSYVPENARLDQLLEHFRSGDVEIALCVDEHGTVDGLVSISDVASRFVEEFAVADSAGESNEHRGIGVRRLGPHRWSVPGRLGIHEFAELFPLKPDSRATTVGGLVTLMLGRIPSPGDRARVGDIELVVESMTRNVVERVEVLLHPPGNADDPAAEAGSAGARSGGGA
ncbi:MAG: hemolysin family protein [Phycisphaerales bacterium]